jgi:flagellar hook assembly protein FlgD
LEFGLRVEQLTPLSRIALINYSVPYLTHVKIAIYDVAGRLTKSVIDEKVKPGRYSEDWKGKDDAGRTLASGVYFVKMITDDYKKTVKVVILE